MTPYYRDSGRASGHAVFGIVLITLGILSLLNNLGVIAIPSLWRLLWPALIIWVGFNMIRRKQERHGWRPHIDSAPGPDPAAFEWESPLNLTASWVELSTKAARATSVGPI